jgi:holo-[acyl-carrier protein] synthase
MDDAVAAALRERVFSDDERAYCDATGHPAQHYAVRWAATEAVLKLLDSPGSVAPGSVTVVREDTGPALALADEARRALATTLGTTTWHTDVSLSHDREADAALAQVVVVTEGSRA